MKCYDFEYDGIGLKELGYMMCNFSSTDLKTITNGSQINFSTIPTLNGNKFELLSTSYTECLETTFQICKNLCGIESNSYEITVKEVRELMSWLNRKGYYKFKFLMDGYYDLYFESSFNVSLIKLGNTIVGLELNMKTNRPFALQDEKELVFTTTSANSTIYINDESDEEGYIYPQTSITIKQNGNLTITNKLENRTMYIKNCVVGEVINLDYPIITTNVSSHKIQNDFNWNFMRIVNEFRNSENIFTVSLPCDITIKYSPVAKITL